MRIRDWRSDVGSSDLPEPMSGWLKTVTRSGSSITVGGARSRLDDMWQAQVVPLWRAALAGRYPIVSNSPRDIPLDDFTRLLGPGGLIDAFFNTQPLGRASCRERYVSDV